MIKLLLALSLITSASVVSAQQMRNCGPRDIVVERLSNSYGETRQSVGLGANNSLIEVFASEETGTWTIIVTTPNENSCLVASGIAYQEMNESLAPKGDDT